MVTAAVVIAGLVAALRIQGSRLHKAQVALLAQGAQSGVAQAQKAYDDARTAYLNAGGTL
jgi:malic enzyme